MNLNDLLHDGENFDPKQVLVLRHRPKEPELYKWLPWLAAEKPDVFNAYQQTQGERLQNVMQGLTGAGYIASFIGHKPGKALFVGLYSIASSKTITYEEYWQVQANIELKAYGHREYTTQADWPSSLLWFELVCLDFCKPWKGKLSQAAQRLGANPSTWELLKQSYYIYDDSDGKGCAYGTDNHLRQMVYQGRRRKPTLQRRDAAFSVSIYDPCSSL